MKKIIYIFILGFQIVSAQEVRVTDNKGTIYKIRNNQVKTSNSPPLPSLENDIWFDNSDMNNVITKIWDGTSWKDIKIQSKTIILNKNGGNLPTATNIFFDLPINATDIQNINTTYFNVTGSGEITILKNGNYLISSELSTTNMPIGDTKYILAVFINGVRQAYLSRGFASLPNEDFWGATGVIMYRLNANDIVNIKYVINAGGTPLSADFLNIGITKL